MDQTFSFVEQAIQLFWAYGPRVILSLAIIWGGLWLIGKLTHGFDIFLKGRKVDESLRPFFTSLADTAMKIVLVLMVASTMGFEITSFIAIFSAIAFSIGLALQGSLGNFASGILILLFRPYKVGDLVSVHGFTGRVSEIHIFNTALITSSGKKVIIPNGKITEAPIETIAEKAEVVAEVSLLLNNKTSMELLRSTVNAVIVSVPGNLSHKKAEVHVHGISREDMTVNVGCWVLGQDYEKAMDHLYEALKVAFEQVGIELAKERRKESK
jgi:small conductance mechanosensitive channel